MSKPKTVSLVLGSGGARGLAHVGVIKWLEEHGFQIASISGCSMGALIGGVYAAGKLDEFEKWVIAIDKFDIITLLDISWESSGLIKGDKIINTLIELVGDQHIESLPIKFTAVAADIKREKEVWISDGRLFDAIRASISLPLFFTPVERDNVLLIDGGVLNPVPIAPTFHDNTDLTIAINLGGKPQKKFHKTQPLMPPPTHPKPGSDISEQIKHFIEKIKKHASKVADFDFAVYDIANQAFDAMQSTIAREKLAAYPPDFTVEIARNACGTLEFDRAEEMIDMGYEEAAKALGELLQ
ncbi:MAG: patatin-like phospholipase family protein [Sulfurovum sp.]|nr:patatin-like phospholipase family protein [Sulfurovum sp.]